jgi:hypothetical protein
MYQQQRKETGNMKNKPINEKWCIEAIIAKSGGKKYFDSPAY